MYLPHRLFSDPHLKSRGVELISSPTVGPLKPWRGEEKEGRRGGERRGEGGKERRGEGEERRGEERRGEERDERRGEERRGEERR